MPMMGTRTKVADPLEKFREGVRVKGGARPVPLTATAIAVRIEGGVAIVTTERTFRNAEGHDIEPTMTFPVPTDAALFALSAEIDGRRLEAECQPREKARETYEDALDRGKAAVLHEELLKGVHMLSVGRVRPGAEVKVTSVWTAPLSFVGGEPGLRVPTTVGEIFGRQPLPDSDALTVGDHPHRATVGIECVDGAATLLGGPKKNKAGLYEVALDAPIEIAVAGWKPRAVHGVAADGRKVTLDVRPAPKADADLDVDLVVDRSGSMDDRNSGAGEDRATKHDAVMAGLRRYAGGRIGDRDRVRGWQFNSSVSMLGAAEGKAGVMRLLDRFETPSGGTELGLALDAVIAAEGTKNVLLATDGKTWAFDAQKYARLGVRVTVVLIGEDALESGVTALAGITGGQVVVPLVHDAGRAVEDALDAARLPFAPSDPIEGRPKKVAAFRRGAAIEAVWSGAAKKPKTPADLPARAIGALAAALAIPSMVEDEAARLAAEEGIVCHLTSLVMVDEAGAASEGVPATRKVDLMRPRTVVAATTMDVSMRNAEMSQLRASASYSAASGVRVRSLFGSGASLRSSPRIGRGMDSFVSFESQGFGPSGFGFDVGGPFADLSSITGGLAARAASIDWDAAPDALRAGDLSSLPVDLAAAIRLAAMTPEIVAAAAKAKLDPVAFVVALLARAASGNRTAGRIARVALKGLAETDLAAAARVVGI